MHLQVDCVLGDLITPDPDLTDFPTLLDLPAAQLRMCPKEKETVVGEKFEANVRLNMASQSVLLLPSDFLLCHYQWAFSEQQPISILANLIYL